MSGTDMRKVETEWKKFSAANLTPPNSCHTIDELRACVDLLCRKIEEYRIRIGYVPMPVYALLDKYNQQQNRLLRTSFRCTYGSL
jgi:hypothetical protein